MGIGQVGPANQSTGGNGNVTGPNSAVSGHLAVFSGTTGKIIADGGAVPTPISGLTPNTLTKGNATGDGVVDSGAVESAGTFTLTESVAINLNSGAGVTTIGDTGGAVNGTTLSVNDGAGTVSTSSSASFVANGGIVIAAGNTLVPSSASGVALGSTALPLSTLIIGNAANNSSQLTGTFTGNRVATLPDATGTVQLVGAANTGAILAILVNNTVLAQATGTVYASPGNDGTALSIGTEGNVSFPITRAGTIRNLYVRTGGTAKVNTPATVITIRKNGVDTGVTLTMTQTVNTTTSDTTHSFTVVAGDLITVSFVTTGAAAVSTSIAGVSFEID